MHLAMKNNPFSQCIGLIIPGRLLCSSAFFLVSLLKFSGRTWERDIYVKLGFRFS